MNTVPVVGKIQQQPTRPVAAQPARPIAGKFSVAGGVAQAVKSSIIVPKTIRLGNTNDLGLNRKFRVCIFGETDARKSTTAAQFGTPEEVRIVLTRREEQLTPLEGMGYKFAEVSDEPGLRTCVEHPESVWTDPTWVNNPNRTLVIDDTTAGVNILLDDAEVIDGKVVRNRMRSYDAAGKVLRSMIKFSFRAPQHVVMTSLAKVKENPLNARERVILDLPPSMMSGLITELEYVFYIDKGLWKLYTRTKIQTLTDYNEMTGRKEEYTREIFSKNKLALKYKDANILAPEENMDLRGIWNKILGAKAKAAAVGVKK